MKMKKADVACSNLYHGCHYHVYCADSRLAAGYICWQCQYFRGADGPVRHHVQQGSAGYVLLSLPCCCLPQSSE